jgi:inorganic pyrophosphatase
MDKKITNSVDYLNKEVSVKIDRPLGSKHPKYDWLYPLNYGFVPDTLSPDGEELDAYVVGVDKAVDSFVGTCVAIIRRSNDQDEAVHFQEQFFSSSIIRK